MSCLKDILNLVAFIPVHVLTLCITALGSPFLVGIYVKDRDISEDDIQYLELLGNNYTFKFTLLLFYGIYSPVWFPLKMIFCRNWDDEKSLSAQLSAAIVVYETEINRLRIREQTLRRKEETLRRQEESRRRQEETLRNIIIRKGNELFERKIQQEEKFANLRRAYDDLVASNESQIDETVSDEAIDIEEDQPALNCAICFNDMLDEEHHQIVFTPCGHTCCNNCAPRLTECHQCRVAIENKLRVFDA